MPTLIQRAAALAAAALVAVAVPACGSDSGTGDSAKLALVAYSTPKEAYQEIIPAFQKTRPGTGVTFTQSYGPSGDQSRAVQAGLPADVVALSLAPDVEKLVDKGKVATTWQDNPHKGFVTNSVVVFVVRKGNPKGIRTWDDLVKKGTEVIEPNPFTSGGARWNVMAAYGAQLEQGKTPDQATDYLGRLFANVPVQDKSAREALQTFVGGKGDVLISYENEAITAQQKSQDVEYVIPPQTILIENPVAATTKSPAKAQAFVDYLWTPAAQKVFVAKGYRSVLPALNDPKEYPKPQGLFTIAKLGGWNVVTKKFFDPQDSVVAKIEQGLGVSTAK